MNKIVPFKKEIEFETNIAEISSISLEHTLKLKEENLVSGEFIVSGTFKMTEASVNTDSFEYRLPFDISIDTKYDTKNIDVDINDFYYEVINSKILEVNIEVILDGLEEKEERTLIEENIETLNENSEDAEEVKENPVDDESPKRETSQAIKSIFEALDENERYAVYKVHIVTENDTVETVINKYGITKNDLEAYNDLTDLKIGDKLIIPFHED